MPTLVEKLQIDAMDPAVRVSDLLRRVKFTATQLGLGSVEDWVERELNGYNGVKPPEYRMVQGRPMAQHPYSGWQNLPCPDYMRSRSNNQAISAIEAMLASATSDTRLHIPFPEAVSKELAKQNGPGWQYDLVVAPSEMARIVDQVRNLVLDWALNLQKAGVMGNEISFNETEKEKAQSSSMTITIGSIGSFAGSIGQGNVSGNNTIRVEQVQSIIDQLKPHLPAIADAGADSKQLSERIAALEEALRQSSPSVSTIRGMITDLRNTLTGAAGNLIATGAISALNVILGTGVPA